MVQAPDRPPTAEEIEKEILAREAEFRAEMERIKARKRELGIKSKRYTPTQQAKDAVKEIASDLADLAEGRLRSRSG
jgi:hypothetical protein